MTTSYREIYERHRGPYSFLLTRQVEGKKGQMEEVCDAVAGPMGAEEAHEEARTLVNSAKDNVIEVYVFSMTEGQFIGALYRRGGDYKPWSLEETRAERMELAGEPTTRSDSTTLLREGDEPLRPVDAAGDERLPDDAVPEDRPVRNVPPKKQAQPRAERLFPPRRVARALEVDPGNAEQWPKSDGASILRGFLERVGRATVPEIVAQLTEDLGKAGVAFPASLVSRLKQRGLLREVEES